MNLSGEMLRSEKRKAENLFEGELLSSLIKDEKLSADSNEDGRKWSLDGEWMTSNADIFTMIHDFLNQQIFVIKEFQWFLSAADDGLTRKICQGIRFWRRQTDETIWRFD